MESNAGFEALSDAVLAIASERSVEPILQKLVDVARDLAGARYAAIGFPDDEGGFAVFLTAGMSDALIEAIGPLPRSHGMLDAILDSAASYRTRDLQDDPRFVGWWPTSHPDMRSMLGVPIASKGTTIGAFYLTDKVGAPEFTAQDQALIERFAAHAAVAIDNARLFERSRELSVVEERNRLARELHDSVTQALFSVSLTAEAAVQLVDRDLAKAKEQVTRVSELAREALAEMRSMVFELRPADLENDGLVATLRKHVDIVRRVHNANVELAVTGERRLDEQIELALFRIVQEALNNALKHSGPGRVAISIEMTDGRVRTVVSDTGKGFEPTGLGVRTKHLGLTSMEERADEIGAVLKIESTLARGTTVSIEVSA